MARARIDRLIAASATAIALPALAQGVVDTASLKLSREMALVPAAREPGSGKAKDRAAGPPKAADAPETELDTLRRQLAARQVINEELSRRIEALERQLAAASRGDAPLVLGLDADLPRPVEDALKAESLTAIEEALVSKGLVLMPAGRFRTALGTSWTHNGTGPSRSDSYAATATLEGGLPWGMAAAISVPYIWLDYPYGTNRGVGDASVAVAMKLSNESASLPSIVGKLSYSHDNGKDAFSLPAIGSGFRSYGASLSAVKRFDPVVVYGSVSYARAPEKTAVVRLRETGEIVFQGNIAPGDTYGLGLGVSLAATPGVTLDAGLALSHVKSSRFDELNAAFSSGSATVGYLSLGTSFLLTRRMSLSINAAAGVTRDASDFQLSIALPYRF